jgi:hypothetical protein
MTQHQGNGSEARRLNVGIGRAISDESLGAFIEAFADIVPPEAQFKPRLIPGINYVSANKLAWVAKRYMAQVDRSQFGPLISVLVASLCEEEKFETTTALSPVTVTLDSFRFKQPGSNVLRAFIQDKRSDFYPDECLMEGEKHSLNREFGFRRQQRSRNAGLVYTHALSMGVVSGDFSIVIPDMLQQAHRITGDQFELQAVGPVSSS